MYEDHSVKLASHLSIGDRLFQVGRVVHVSLRPDLLFVVVDVIDSTHVKRILKFGYHQPIVMV